MVFTVISHTPHSVIDGKVYAYAPYVREMNIWAKYAKKIVLVVPCTKEDAVSPILESYDHDTIEILEIPSISFVSFTAALEAVLSIPFICWQIYKGMRKSQHIHLRCPGNIGLLGVCMQCWFPKKRKTAKYAGNWDPEAQQPLSYRIQKALLSHPFFSKNMKVLVYGEWPNATSNILPFFTATYTESQKPAYLEKKSFQEPFRAVFVGSLSEGKRPLYAVKLVESLRKAGVNISLRIYGEGTEAASLGTYISENKLGSWISLEGVATSERMIDVYRSSHILLLPSKSEGWPKVVAEAMFWGVLPVVTPISCVPWMLGNGTRGLLLSLQLEEDTQRLQQQFSSLDSCLDKSEQAQLWSRAYTLDAFEASLKKLLV